MDEDRVIDSFRRTPTEEVRATLRTYRGRRYMDVRVYYLDDEGEFRPTKKGVNLSVEYVPELTAMIGKLVKAAAEEGPVAAAEEPAKPRGRRSTKTAPAKADPAA